MKSQINNEFLIILLLFASLICNLSIAESDTSSQHRVLDSQESISYPARTIVTVIANNQDGEGHLCLGVLTSPNEVETVGDCFLKRDWDPIEEKYFIWSILLPKEVITIEVAPSLKKYFPNPIKAKRRLVLETWKPEDSSDPNPGSSQQHTTLIIDQPIGDKLGYMGVYGVRQGNPGTLPNYSKNVLSTCEEMSTLNDPKSANPLDVLIVKRQQEGERYSDQRFKSYSDESLASRLRVCSFEASASTLSMLQCGLLGIGQSFEVWESLQAVPQGHSSFLMHNCSYNGDVFEGAPIFYVTKSLPVLIGLNYFPKEKDKYRRAAFYLGVPPKPLIKHTKTPK